MIIMIGLFQRCVLTLVMMLTALSPCRGQKAADSEPTKNTMVRIREGGFYPKWSRTKNLIVFNEFRKGESFTKNVPGTYELYTMKPDGSDVQWLTRDAPQEIHRYHKAQPFWHPSGNYVIFTAQNEHTKAKGINLASFPGIGWNHDVWITSDDGSRYWRITHNPDNWGVIRPSFSHDGRTLYWNEEYSMEKHPGVGSNWNKKTNRAGEEWGLWRIKLADVAWEPEGPVVSNIRAVNINELHPGMRLIEGSGFAPDDQHLIWEAANIEETEGKMWWGDVYVSDLAGGSLQRLTRTAPSRQGNENMEYSPDGARIAWSHHDSAEPGKDVEIYQMKADGSKQARLTFFNQRHHPHRRQFQPLGSTNACGELDWSPDGRQIVFGMSTGLQARWPHVFRFSLYSLTIGKEQD